ncbi:hypothetical protein N0V95_008875 [Ascochyta clinopodiicola]|nr:hypothetical protein N0V95_008875 [Ascochyta clinopodiicola]
MLLHTVRLQRLVSQSTSATQEPYWQGIKPWKDVSAEDFKSYRWQLANTVPDTRKLHRFLSDVLPPLLGPTQNPLLKKIRTKEQFIEDATAALKLAPMAIRLTPHLLSVIDWNNPLDDPIRRQFLPLASGIVPDHEGLKLDSLNEQSDSPTSICPVYCRFCTRSYAVGANTETVSKSPQKPSRRRWEVVFQHIENTPSLHDIVVSGGDAYYLQPDDLKEIGERFVDMAKQVCLHTHINHVNEITWVTREAANRLFKHGVIVRNQSVLLKGVNDTKEDLSNLIETLASMNIQPYYIYQCDMVRGVEDLRTPLSKIIELDRELRGTLSGFMMPAFVVDLPGGGGKRLVSTYDSYDAQTGVAKYRAPGLPGYKGTLEYEYHDPKVVTELAVEELRQEQEQALEQDMPLQDFASPTISRQVVSTPPPGIGRQIPPYNYEPSPPQASIAANSRLLSVKPEDLAPHIGTNTWQPSAAAP